MLNYRHLYYFWVATKEGGIARAAERLDMAVQTVSTQIRELERALGHALFKPSARTVELMSLNPEHPNRTLEMTEVEWIARIIWASQ